MNPIAYLTSVWAELRKVQWPTLRTVIGYFFSVVIGMILATLIVWGFDYVFLRLVSLIIK